METIFASSNQYVSAIKIIRISGPKAKKIPKIFSFSKSKPKMFQVRKLKYKHKTIDTIPVVWLPGPNTYTGEDIYELHIHGAASVEEKIYNVLLNEKNFKIADKGEFTRRAVLNGKMDLTQAEAVNDLINSDTEKQLELANSIIDGNLKQILFQWREQIINLSSNIEVLIDFADEDIPFGVENQFKKSLKYLINEIEESLRFSSFSRSIRNGFIVSIIGKPNVGKSSLMNCIIDKEVSIVTNIEGTTRDLIEHKKNLNGFPVYFNDTAGIRETDSIIEEEGIKKTKEIIFNSDIILNLSDKGQFSLPFELKKLNIINVSTKNDINNKNFKNERISISVKTNKGITNLLKMIFKELKELEPTKPTMLSNLRQINGVKKALKALKRIKNLSLKKETELVAEELRLSSSAISNITSVVDIDEVLDQIFNKFCIGK